MIGSGREKDGPGVAAVWVVRKGVPQVEVSMDVSAYKGGMPVSESSLYRPMQAAAAGSMPIQPPRVSALISPQQV